MKLKLLSRILFMSLMMPLSLIAQEATLKVSAKNQVRAGEQFQVSFELDAEGDNFRGPNFENIQVLNGPFSSTSSSINIVNGAMSRSFTQTYTYYLRADKEGTVNIGEASVKVKGKKIKSQPFTIQVVAGNVQTQQSSSGTNQSGGTATVGGKDVYMKAIVNKKKAFVGEQLIVTYRIYTKVPISSVSISKSSSFGGFWTKSLLENDGTLQQSTEVINGEEYIVADIQKFALFPQRPGKLTIDPMELECVAQIRTQGNRQRSNDPFESFFNDPFFNRNYTNVQKKLATNAVEIEVQPLPLAGKPASFNGAVGQFAFQADIDRQELKTNEAFNLVLTATGKGNVELIEFPKLNFPPDFEVYDPKVTSNLKVSPTGVSGTRKAEYLAIPRVPGEFTIEPITFSYFDPTTKEYKTLTSKEFKIQVSRGSQSEEGMVLSSPNQEGIRYLGSDIQHIKTDNLSLKHSDEFYFLSNKFFIVLAAMIVVFFGILIYTNRKNKLNQNQLLVRNKKATKIARKRLNSARVYLKQKEQNEFYIEMSQALWGYIADKFGIVRSNLSIDTVKEMLETKNADKELIQQIVDTLNNCEFARFAPGEANKKMEELYHQGIEMITKAEKMIK